MKSYFGFFAAVYSIAMVMLGILQLLHLAIISMLPLLVAVGCFTAGHFVTKAKRPPNAQEKLQLIWGCSAIAITLSSVLVFLFVITQPDAEQIILSAKEAGLALPAIIMFVSVVVHAAVFAICFGWYARLYYQKTKDKY